MCDTCSYIQLQEFFFYKFYVHDESLKWISHFKSNKFYISLVWHDVILHYYLLFTYRHLAYH